MSIITTYPNIGGIASDDLMIISDVSKVDNPTRTVSIGQLAASIGGGGGGVATTVLGTSPLVAETDGSTVTLSILPASSTQDGYLTSTVFNTLSDKQNALVVTKNGTSGEATFDGTTLNIPNYTNSGGGGSTVVANPGSPTAYLSTLEIDSTSYELPTYNANEVAFWISRDPNNNNIVIRSIKSTGSSDGTTFSIAEEGTLTGAFIITASTNWWAEDTFWVTMSINCPVSYLVDTKQVVKRATVNRINSSQLQVEFFMETSSVNELLERVDLVVADTTAPNAAQGIDIRVKRYMFPQ